MGERGERRGAPMTGTILVIVALCLALSCALYATRRAARWARPGNVRRMIGGQAVVVNARQAAMLDSLQAVR